jgi:hypothetical protein
MTSHAGNLCDLRYESPLQQLQIHFLKEEQEAVLPSPPSLHPEALLGYYAPLQTALQEYLSAVPAGHPHEKRLEGHRQHLGAQIRRHLRRKAFQLWRQGLYSAER